MTRKEQIQGAYRFLGGKESNFYDGMMICSTFAGTAVSKGFFTPPFETVESLRKRLSSMYAQAEVSAMEGIACFRCVK